MKILVCDDESIMRDLHIGLLVEKGINPDDIIEAADGNEALRLMEEHDIRLFLIDWNMPGLDGVELVKTIRRTKEYENTPIVMITVEGGRHSIIEALEAGVTNYVLKPILPDLFWAKIVPYAKEFLPLTD
jgi:two-component system chemotaxis response regulator CheY